MNSQKKTMNGQMATAKLFFATIFTVVLFLAGQSTCFATTVVFQWDAVTDSELAGYKVYYQADSSVQPFTGTGAIQGNSPVDFHNQTTATIGGLDPNHGYYFAVTAYYTSGVESAYSNTIYVPEMVAPTIAISAPANNASVSGTVPFTVNASDNVGVTKVEFYVNGTLQATDTSTPYLYSWNTSSLAVGTYTLMAKAYDAAGNVGQSSNVSVKVVRDITVPVVSITSPANNSTVNGTVTIAATASDNLVLLNTIEIYLNGTLLGAGNVSPLSLSWDTTSVANGSYTLVAKAYDTTNNVGTSSNVTVTVNNIATQRVNVALASNGGVATASSTFSLSGNYTPASVNDGDRKGLNWGAGGGWNDATPNAYPDWAQIAFNGQKTITEIDVFSLQDNYTNPIEPTSTLTFTKFGLNSFDVQYWNGTSWLTVPGGSITGNNLVWRKVTFPAITTNQIRVQVNLSPDGYSRLTEIEAYTTGTAVSDTTAPTVSLTSPSSGTTVSGTVAVAASASDNVGVTKVELYVNNVLQATDTASPYTFSWDTTSVANGSYTLVAKAYDATNNVGTSSNVTVTVNNIATQRVNVALASNGGVATASTTFSLSGNYTPTSVNDGDRKGLNWGAGGGWNDATPNAYPDWAQIAFNGQKTITEVDVFSLQDNYTNPIEPTSTLTFTKFGLNSFDVQYWNGTSWLTVPGGSITGNNLVWRKVTFPAITTNQIRVQVNLSPDGYSRLTEIEAYTTGTAVSDTTAPTVSLTSPSSGTTVSGTVAVAASASDNVGVTKVELYVNNVLQATDTASPYTFSWDTTSVANGSYTLVAKAYDATNNVGTSSNVTVTVNNIATQRVNVALASNGGVATASSTFSLSGNYTPTSVNDGDRKGLNWGAGGGWNDATPNAYPDWAQIAFNGQKTITEVDVFSVQNNYANPIEPTSTLTFTNYGLSSFDVQYSNGYSWVTVPGGSITGNNLVWRKVTFPAITTKQIRVLVNLTPDGYSRLTEIEAY